MLVKVPLVNSFSTPSISSALQWKVPEISFFSLSNLVITTSPVGLSEKNVVKVPVCPRLKLIIGLSADSVINREPVFDPEKESTTCSPKVALAPEITVSSELEA